MLTYRFPILTPLNAATHSYPMVNHMQLFDAMPNSFQEKRFNCFVTDSADLIREARFLRCRVLAGEHCAKLEAVDELPDYDEFDAYCDHLIVFDYFQLKVVACTRLLNQQQAQKIGYFRAQTEFDLGAIFDLPGRLLEVGRICIDPAYCNSTVMSELCSGLARHALEGRYQYLFGRASIPRGPDGFGVEAICRGSTAANLPHPDILVDPLIPVPLTEIPMKTAPGREQA